MLGSAAVGHNLTRVNPDDVSLDFIWQNGDEVEIDVQDDIAGKAQGRRLMKVYININGRTMLRIEAIPVNNLHQRRPAA